MSDAECWLRIGEFSGGQRIEQEIREFPDTPQAVYFAPKSPPVYPFIETRFPDSYRRSPR